VVRETNPFPLGGELPVEEMIDRDAEVEQLLALVEGGTWFQLVAPRRYGKTTLLRRVLRDAESAGFAVAIVDLEGVLSLPSIVVRIERAYAEHLQGPVRRTVEAFLRSTELGLSLGVGGFAATVRSNPRVDAETVLLRLLEVPARIAERRDARTLIVFDEFQDLLNVEGADAILRSVIQHQGRSATYGFAGSSPSMMQRLFAEPSRPLLEQALPVRLGPLPYEESYTALESRFTGTGRSPGDALEPLLAFARGHPQRTIQLAHHLWALTPRGSVADADAWLEAVDHAVRDAAPLLAARLSALPVNEQRLALALAAGNGSVYGESVYGPVGLKRGSIRTALDGLEGRGDVIRTRLGPQLTDPLFERWLEERGLG
jgi:hypothetical protein